MVQVSVVDIMRMVEQSPFPERTLMLPRPAGITLPVLAEVAPTKPVCHILKTSVLQTERLMLLAEAGLAVSETVKVKTRLEQLPSPAERLMQLPAVMILTTTETTILPRSVALLPILIKSSSAAALLLRISRVATTVMSPELVQSIMAETRTSKSPEVLLSPMVQQGRVPAPELATSMETARFPSTSRKPVTA